jgi:hypothetical protein
MNRGIPIAAVALLAAEGLYRPVGGGGGGGGITQLLSDVTAGPGSGAVPATVVAIHGASVPAAGALTTGNVLQVTGASALGYAPVNLAGGANFVTGLLPVTNIAPAGTNGFVLTTTGGATVWAAAASGGITQLTGDGTAGPGSGSQALTVVRINGATVPAAGSLTTGNGLYVTGTSALGYSALNLAGGSGYVTGLLPVANIAPAGTNGFVLTTTGGATVWAAASGGSGITQLTQDVTAGPGSGSQAATVVQAQAGVFAFSSGGTQTWSSVSTPILVQTATSGATGANFSITPQTSSNGSANTGGSLVVNLQTPLGSGTEAALQINRGGTPVAAMGPLPSAGSTFSAVWLGAASLPTTASNYNIGSNGSTTNFNASTQVNVVIAGSLPVMAGIGEGVQLFSFTPALAGGVGVLGITAAGTLPTTLQTSGIVLASSIAAGLTGLHGYQAGSFFTDQMLFPLFQGTQNTQVGKIYQYAGVCTTPAGSPVTICAIPLATASTSVGITATMTGRNVNGLVAVITQVLGFKNVSGTVTAVSTQATQQISADTGLSTCAIGVNISGTTVQLTAVPPVSSSTSIDWTMKVEAMYT